jgi:hypothetical protein
MQVPEWGHFSHNFAINHSNAWVDLIRQWIYRTIHTECDRVKVRQGLQVCQQKRINNKGGGRNETDGSQCLRSM